MRRRDKAVEEFMASIPVSDPGIEHAWRDESPVGDDQIELGKANQRNDPDMAWIDFYEGPDFIGNGLTRFVCRSCGEVFDGPRRGIVRLRVQRHITNNCKTLEVEHAVLHELPPF